MSLYPCYIFGVYAKEISYDSQLCDLSLIRNFFRHGLGYLLYWGRLYKICRGNFFLHHNMEKWYSTEEWNNILSYDVLWNLQWQWAWIMNKLRVSSNFWTKYRYHLLFSFWRLFLIHISYIWDGICLVNWHKIYELLFYMYVIFP